MKPNYMGLEFKIQDADDKKGIIRGYASTFGNIDLGDDVVDEGAFKKTLQETKGVIPILADHDPSKQIGWNLRAMEDSKGLFFEGKLDIAPEAGNDEAKRRYSLAKQALEHGGKFGVSIGYGVIKAMPDKERPAIRRLKELKLYEYSLVTFPMNTEAMVTAAKSWIDTTNETHFIQSVKECAKSLGINPRVLANALLAEGAAETVNDDPAVSQSLDRLLKTIKEGI